MGNDEPNEGNYQTGEEAPVIVLENLTKEYRVSPTHHITAVSNASLSIWRGEFVAVTGPPGSGKSSLLQMIGCLDRPTAGSIWIDGEEVTKLPTNALPRVRGEKMGFIFQAHHLVPTLTVIENVMLPLRYRKVPQVEAERLAAEWLVKVGLENRLYHRPSELNGLEQQSVAIARALVNSPLIILADEPTGELDAEAARELLELMRGLNYEYGQTYVLVTQNDEIASMCDRIVQIEEGKIIDDSAFPDQYGKADGFAASPADDDDSTDQSEPSEQS